MTARVRHLAVLLAATALAVTVAACGSVSDHALRATRPALDVKRETPAASTRTRPVVCRNPTASLRPRGSLPAPGQMPSGTLMHRIQRRGHLVVGVDQTTLLVGYLNPFSGRIDGFDIDIARQIAKAIFGNPHRIQFKAISSAQRIPVVQSGSVDLVADAMTINCDRLRQVAFSTVYFDAGQRILVPSNSRVRRLRDLRGKRVCATTGSTSLQNIRRMVPGAIVHPVALRTDCLVALQAGEADAISTDDSILFGFRAQDPYTKIVGPRFSSEPYGLAMNKNRSEFVRFVNGVLEQIRADGTWAAIYRKWLGRFVPTPSPPSPRYRD